MNVREFEKNYRELIAAYENAPENPMSFEVHNCTHCAACHFCSDCDSCYHCTHCEGLVACSHCTRCRDCENSHGCAYCTESNNCTGSKYLVRCEACADSTYCFGCVGLQKKDFHILNEPYDRSTFFKVVGELKKALGIKD